MMGHSFNSSTMTGGLPPTHKVIKSGWLEYKLACFRDWLVR